MHELITILWPQLLKPLLRILFLVALGLTVANLIEALGWTRRLAVLARPLVRAGRLSDIAGASFSMAFFSGVSANTMLAEAFDQGRLDKQELVLANLLNSLPRFFLHLPTVFFLTLPLIKAAAVIYVGLTFSAAMLQTLLVVALARFLLPARAAAARFEPRSATRASWPEALRRTWARLRKRLRNIALFMTPIYILFFLLGRYGLFSRFQQWLAGHAWFLAWLDPKSLGIVVLHVTTEFSAGLAAAGALLAGGDLGYRQVVLALLAGNVLAAPIRAARHQFPYYVGIFRPRLAAELVGISQLCRLASLLAVGTGYFLLSR